MATSKDPFEVQISIRYRTPKGVEPSAKLQEEWIREWARTGKSPRNVKINVIRWRNRGRLRRADAGWRYAKSESERQCKLIRQFIAGGAAVDIVKPRKVQKIRRDGGV